MNQGQPQLTLDDILRQTRHLLLSFNGPVCPLFAETTSAVIAAQLRDVITEQGAAISAEMEQTTDWQQILTYAVAIGPQLAESVEAELTKLESASAQAARPTPHLHEMVTSCRESGRSLAVIGDASATVVRSYLIDHSLDNAITVIVARTPGAQIISTSSQIEWAANYLGTGPTACAFLTATSTGIEAAWHAGAHSIGYAKTSDGRDELTDAGASNTVSNLADLTLRFRAQRPGV